MKRCPKCERTFPDSEKFCDTDGTALVDAQAGSGFPHPAGRTFDLGEPVGQGGEAPVLCPVCGGKAEPGELVCNFCGAALGRAQGAAPPIQAPQGPTAWGSPESGGTGRRQVTVPHLEDSVAPPDEEPSPWSRVLVFIGYGVAAVVALAGGAWLAVYLHHRGAPMPEQAQVSPSAAVTPVPSGPMMALAGKIPVQVSGMPSGVPDSGRSAATAAFNNNHDALLGVYKEQLASIPGLADAMAVHLKVDSSGSVAAVSIRTSTASNPSLDAAVVNTMAGWSFTGFSGNAVEIQYPIVFAPTAAQFAGLQDELNNKLASLSPTEPAEYAWAPAPPATPSPAVAAAPSAVPTPAVAAVTPPRRPIRRAPVRRSTVSRPRKPAPSLLQRVDEALRRDRRFGRVKAYTDSGGKVVIYGQVFNDRAKAQAERMVRSVSGVTRVVNNLTTDTAQWAAEQVQIAQQLRNAGLSSVTVTVIGDGVYLDGEVSSELEKQRAVAITESAAPVHVRENLIRVAPGKVFGF